MNFKPQNLMAIQESLVQSRSLSIPPYFQLNCTNLKASVSR